MSKLPVALLASRLLQSLVDDGPRGLLVVVDSEARAATLARLLRQMHPGSPKLHFPAWDCLPYDRAAPSADIMGQRMSVLHELGAGPRGAIVTMTPEALVQRVPPAAAASRRLRVAVGESLESESFGAALAALGYTHADRVDDAGHVAIRGEVIDVFTAAPKPYRISVMGGTVTAIHAYDPVSQRSVAEIDALEIGAASEVVEGGDVGAESEPTARFTGMEHWLPSFYAETRSLFDVMPDALMVMEPRARDRVGPLLAQVAEAYQERSAAEAANKDGSRKALPPDRMFVSLAAVDAETEARARPYPGEEPDEAVPRFCLDDKPGKAFTAFLKERLAAGDRLVLSAAREADLVAMEKQAKRATGEAPRRAGRWTEVAATEAGKVASVKMSADVGFIDKRGGVVLVTAADLLGHHAGASSYHAVPVPWHMGEGEFAFGDAVIHAEHGVGVLKNIETIDTGAVSGRETLRITYAKNTDLLVPAEEMDRVWRYGSAQEGVSLDKLDANTWQKRRSSIMRDIADTARTLVSLAKLRNETKATRIVPPRREYESFVAGFPHAPTPDQIHAIDDCLADLASGRPMDRLVVGDVGFGKTEVALRAAAAAVLAGQQVALIAPTTVLVRQHVQIFERRFAELGIAVAHLSRLVSPTEARRVKDGLADGTVRLVVGTHALTGKGVDFKALGLLIVDEEQRFGTAAKARIRELGAGTHVLTLTATPIPRTLQSALVGLQDLSVIATPPARRRPIRTLVAPYDTLTIRAALLREHARGGQSFVVVPRIETLERMQGELQTLMPELKIVSGHGRMEAGDVESVMSDFAEGRGDVLLATSIIESGLDVPRANTMVVCGADRFGLAQLHQLRGRVGRGRRQGVCYLMTEAGQDMAEATERRLSTLATFDRLGSGLAISAQDLDARGAGDITGEDQAGHMRLIGLGLYQHLLEIAIRQARGEPVEDWVPELRVERAGLLSAAYIPEPEVRLNLYARIARLMEAGEVDDLAAEMEDRFGPLPAEAADALALARLKSLCRRHGVIRVDAGPKAIAFKPWGGRTPDDLLEQAPDDEKAVLSVKDGRLIYRCATAGQDRLRLATDFLSALA